MFVDVKMGKNKLFPQFSFFPRLAIPIILFAVVTTLMLMAAFAHGYKEQRQLKLEHSHVAKSYQNQQQISRDILKSIYRNHRKEIHSSKMIRLLNPIGQALTPDVAIIMLDVDMTGRFFRMEVRARSLESLLDFTMRLQREAVNVEIQNHQPARDETDSWPVTSVLNVSMTGGV